MVAIEPTWTRITVPEYLNGRLAPYLIPHTARAVRLLFLPDEQKVEDIVLRLLTICEREPYHF